MLLNIFLFVSNLLSSLLTSPVQQLPVSAHFWLLMTLSATTDQSQILITILILEVCFLLI